VVGTTELEAPVELNPLSWIGAPAPMVLFGGVYLQYKKGIKNELLPEKQRGIYSLGSVALT
jgi:hypothetical protein